MKDAGRTLDFVNGEFLLFDKPYGWTSFNLVGKVRNLISRQLGIKKLKVGHAGTLDPLATGLMIVCTGKFTKRIQEFQRLDKRYIATLELGKTTPSFDLETEFDGEYDYSFVTREEIEKLLEQFCGEQEQIPPVYSAKYVNGERAYEYARKGKKVEMKPSVIRIYHVKLLEYHLPLVTLDILCSKGTYIRSLVRDIGESLGTGAYLKELVRTAIGPYELKNAMSIDLFKKVLQNI